MDVDAQLVIKYLRQRLHEVELENAILKSQIETMSQHLIDAQEKEAASGNGSPNRAARRKQTAGRKKK